MPYINYHVCPLCQSNNLQRVFDVKDYTVSGKTFEILHCNSCTVRFTQHVPSEKYIGQYYKSEDYISHSNTKKGFVNKLYQSVRVITMKQKAAIVKKHTALKKGSLLDIGCGTGAFLHTMKQQGWEVTGLEPDVDARAVAQSRYGIHTRPSHELFSLLPQSYNAITLWHVLEHVHPLHEYMAKMKNILAPGGVLFIAVPNYTSKDAQSYGSYWAGYDVPRHLYHFSPAAMQKLVQLHGFEISQMLPMWFDSFYVDMLSSKYKCGKTNYWSAGLHGLASNINAVNNTGECCSIIYVVKAIS